MNRIQKLCCDVSAHLYQPRLPHMLAKLQSAFLSILPCCLLGSVWETEHFLHLSSPCPSSSSRFSQGNSYEIRKLPSSSKSTLHFMEIQDLQPRLQNLVIARPTQHLHEMHLTLLAPLLLCLPSDLPFGFSLYKQFAHFQFLYCVL